MNDELTFHLFLMGTCLVALGIIVIPVMAAIAIKAADRD
jgi:hypothetical protein